MLTSEPKKFQAKQLCLLCLCKNDGNAVARSILLVPKIVRKQGPIKLKIKATSFSDIFDPSKIEGARALSLRLVVQGGT